MSCQLNAVQHSNIKLSKKFLQNVVSWNILEKWKQKKVTYTNTKKFKKNQFNKHCDAKYFLLIMLYVDHVSGTHQTSA
jgi:hypothetical protein